MISVFLVLRLGITRLILHFLQLLTCESFAGNRDFARIDMSLFASGPCGAMVSCSSEASTAPGSRSWGRFSLTSTSEDTGDPARGLLLLWLLLLLLLLLVF